MNSPLISIIIPSFNKGELVYQTVQSVQANHCRAKTEIIIVDDHSNDPLTLATYKRLLREFDNLSIIVNGDTKGPGAARNYGLKNCTGDFVLFLDNDDLLSKSFLSSALSTLEHNELYAFAYPNIITFERKTDPSCEKNVGAVISHTILGLRLTPEYSASRLAIHNYIPVTCLYRREALISAGGFAVDLIAMEDWDLFLRLRGNNLLGTKITNKGAYLFYRQHTTNSVNRRASKPIARIHLRREILKRNNLITPTSWMWDSLAVIAGAFQPLFDRLERGAFDRSVPESKKEELLEYIAGE